MDMFIDRVDAGIRLGAALSVYKDTSCLVLAIPRGGVVVGAKVAEALHCALDVVTPRKIGAPIDQEYAIGAVSEIDGYMEIDERAVAFLHIDHSYIESEAQRQIEEGKRRSLLFRGTTDPPDIAGKTAIVVDDGVATGYTTRVALKSLRKLAPEKLILAVPVGAPDSIEILESYADKIICLMQPSHFTAVGCWYQHFGQTSDEEVIAILRADQ